MPSIVPSTKITTTKAAAPAAENTTTTKTTRVTGQATTEIKKERKKEGMEEKTSSPAKTPPINSDTDDDVDCDAAADGENERSCSGKWSAVHQQRHTSVDATPSPASSSSVLLPHDSTGAAAANNNGGDGGAANRRRSAFSPFHPNATVLTNLQRGNTEATVPKEVTLSFHVRAGQGELTEEEVRTELDRQRSGSESGSIDFRDENGFAALHWAAHYGQLAAARMLLNAGADANCKAPEMTTPLMLAASAGHHEVVRLLLDRGSATDSMDIGGNTALMYAAAGNHAHTCNEILSRDPNLTPVNANGDSAYALAIELGAVLAQSVIEQYMITLMTL